MSLGQYVNTCLRLFGFWQKQQATIHLLMIPTAELNYSHDAESIFMSKHFLVNVEPPHVLRLNLSPTLFCY